MYEDFYISIYYNTMSITGTGTAIISGIGNLVFTVYPTAPTNLTASSVTSSSAVIGFTPPPHQLR